MVLLLKWLLLKSLVQYFHHVILAHVPGSYAKKGHPFECHVCEVVRLTFIRKVFSLKCRLPENIYVRILFSHIFYENKSWTTMLST